MPSLDPARLARIVRRLVLPVMVIAAVWVWFCFGSMRVHGAMDTLTGRVFAGEKRPPVPPGSLCIVDKRASSVTEGCAVFVELTDGSVLLSRVVALTEEGMWLENDNEASPLPDSEQLHTVPMERHRGTVLVVFPPDDGRSSASRGAVLPGAPEQPGSQGDAASPDGPTPGDPAPGNPAPGDPGSGGGRGGR